MSKHTFTESDLRTARKMRERGHSWEALGTYFGCDDETIRRQIDPEYRKVRSERYKPPHSQFHVSDARSLPRKDVAARLAEVPPDTRSRAARWMGDPLPGRSALDKKKRMNHGLLSQAGAQKRLSLHDESRGALWETAHPKTEAVR